MTDFPDRRAMLAKVHLAKKDLRLDEEVYRDIVQRVTGCSSSSKCDRPQLVKLLAEFKRVGWDVGAKPAFKESSKRHVRLIFGLWKGLCDADIPDIKTRAALVAFVKNMTKVDNPEWLTVDQARQVTEGLKAWRKRVEAQRQAAASS